tara:strand:- start:432 stop:1067 length:636 start_codon:yes stop_codon:yes gene_type:complete
MPVKKKVLNTQEIPTETETITETTENKEIPDDTCIQKPKKQKRELTEKQKANFAKLQEANKLRYEAKKKAKEEALNNKIQEVEIKKEEIKPIPKPLIEKVQEEEESEEEVVVKKKAPKKKKKQKIIIEEDSDSSSDNEIIIRRSKGKNRSKKQQLHNEGYNNDLKLEEKDAFEKSKGKTELVKEEEVKEVKEELDLNKKYSAKQILQSLGL